MTYATQQDMTDAYGEKELKRLTDRTAAAVIDDVVLGKALIAADAEIDSYLAKRAVTPLDPVPPLVNAYACAIARYKLHKDNVPEAVRNGYLDAVAWLKRAASGEVTVDGLPPSEATPSADMIEIDASPRLFGREDLRVF